MARPPISVEELRKVFKVPVREAGLKASARSLVRRVHRDVVAVGGVTFRLEPGEIVGFLGPNGAGKTTTLKMLSGLLYPDGGTVDVVGHTPSKRERAFLKQIALVMGNRTSMAWDLPVLRLTGGPEAPRCILAACPRSSNANPLRRQVSRAAARRDPRSRP